MRPFLIVGAAAVLAAPACAFADPGTATATAATSAIASGSNWTPFFELSLWRASDAIPVDDLDGDWTDNYVPRRGRNVALSRNRATVGIAAGNWRIAYEARQQATLDTDRETLDLVRLYKQKLDPALPSHYNARVQYRNWAARGLRVGRIFDGPALAGRTPRIELSAAYYDDSRFRQEDVSGRIDYSAPDVYGVQASQTRYDSRAMLPSMIGTPSAKGASISAALDMPLTDALRLSVRVDDLWSRMRWRYLPKTTRTIDSNVTEIDSQGYINYRPLLSGRNQQVDGDIPVERYGMAKLNYHPGAWRHAVQVERYANVTIPTIIAGRQFAWGLLSGHVETRYRTLGIGYEYGGLRLLLQADTLRQRDAKAQRVQLSYMMPF